jgi:hypothetical protein
MVLDPLPDNIVLSTIFPIATTVSTEVLANHRGICTFAVHFDSAPCATWPQDLIVRLDTNLDNPEPVCGLQVIAQMQIPDLAPETLVCSKAALADGTPVAYSVTPFVTDTVCLESIWPSLSRSQ